MGRIKQWARCLAVTLLLFSGLTAMAGAADENQSVVLSGEINEIYQLETEDGEIYEIGINDAGNELVDNHINAKVRVRGTVSTAEDGARIITVASFEVIAE